MKMYFQAEKLKYHHTFLTGLVIWMPLTVVFLSAWLTHDYFTIDCYNWWYIGLYPGLIGVLCGTIGGKDKEKKNYTIWSLPCSMKKIWDAKVLTGALWSGIAMSCMIIFTIVMGKVLEIMMNRTFIVQPTLKAQLTAGVIIWLTTLWQIPFCLFLSQKMGTFLMFLLHMGSYTIISTVISLKSWFAFWPGAITSRLMCSVLGVLPNGLLAVEGQMTWSPELVETQNLLIGIPAAVFWFFVFWRGSRESFQRQVNL